MRNCRALAAVASQTAIVAAIYLAWLFGIVSLCELPFRLEWESTHLIDRHYLATAPFESLWYLHSQPPNFNLLTAFVLWTAAKLSAAPENIAFGTFIFFGFASLLLAYFLLLRITASKWVAVGGVLLILANPGFAYFHQLYFYEMPVLATILFMLFLAERFLETGSRRCLYLLSVTLSLMSLWKSLFHPLLQVSLFGLLVVGWSRCHGHGARLAVGRTALPALVLCLGLTVWPLKNYLMFGSFTYSSWSAFNLSYRFPIPLEPDLSSFTSYGTVSPEAQARLEEVTRNYPEVGREIVRSATKPTTSAHNWNNGIFLLTAQRQHQRAIEWRRENLSTWLFIALGQYFLATRATFIFPYSAEVWGVGNAIFQRWETAYRDIVFFDFRPYVEKWFPNLPLHKVAMVRDQKAPYSTFSLVFPLLSVLVAARIVFRYRSLRRLTSTDVLSVVMLILLSWTILAPSLTDGAEANRMRFATCPLVLFLWMYLLSPSRLAARSDQPTRVVGAS